MFAIRVHHRLDVLADLWIRLRGPQADPLADEPVLIQSRSLAGWLEARRAQVTGISAGIDWLTPRRLLMRLGGALAQDEDPWAREVLRWRLDRLLSVHGADPRFATPTAWLAAGGARARLQFLDRLADAMDTYQMSRPHLLAAWEREELLLDDPHEPWQAALWRALRAEEPTPHAGERLEALMEALAAGTPPRDLPPRLDAIGVTGLSRPLTHLLKALGDHTDVTLWVTQPTPHAWDHLRRGDDAQDGHPLLADLGVQGRAWFKLLQEVDADGQAWSQIDVVDLEEPTTVLWALHHDIANLEMPEEPRPRNDGDCSLTLHRAASALREVEIARDVILQAFADFPTLRPEDVSILTPDLPTYAPLIDTVFARPVPGGNPGLPVALVDRPLAATDPVAQAFLAVVSVIGGRLPRSEVLALLAHEAVLTATGADATTIELVTDLIHRAGIRFGLDAAHRARCGLPPHAEGTWRHGLDRLIAGWLTGDTAPVEGRDGLLWPADGCAGVPAVAEVLAWIHRLLDGAEQAADEAPRQVWAARLTTLLDRLFSHRSLNRAPTAEALTRLALAPDDRPWPLAALADALAADLDEAGRGQPWRGTRIAVGGLKPLAALPRRVVVLVGLDDANFPRRDRPVAFDLIATHPEPADRAPRDDDRQLFLDAVLAARDRLAVIWTGKDPRSGEDRPASVCVDALRAVLARTVQQADALLTTHPVQPPGLVAPPEIPAPFASPLTVEPPAEDLTLEALIATLVNPAKAWLTALGIRLPDAEDADSAEDDDALALTPFTTAILGGEALTEIRSGGGLEVHRLRADGRLPPGGLGTATWASLEQEVTAFAHRCGPLPSGAPRRGVLMGPHGERLAVAFPAPQAQGQVVARFAKVKPKDDLRAWLTHLAWNAWCQAYGDGPGSTRCEWRDAQRVLPPLADPWLHLAPLIAAAHQARRQPLPFWPATSRALVKALEKADEDEVVASAELDPDDARDRWQRLAWRDRPTITADALDLAILVWAPYLGAATP